MYAAKDVVRVAVEVLAGAVDGTADRGWQRDQDDLAALAGSSNLRGK